MDSLVYSTQDEKQFIFNVSHIMYMEQVGEYVRIFFDTGSYKDVPGNIDDFSTKFARWGGTGIVKQSCSAV